MISSLSDRSHYSCLADYRYLNQASLGLIGQPAVVAMHKYFDDIGRHGNLYMSDTEELAFLASLRVVGAAVMNCPMQQLAIMFSSGEMCSQLPYLLQPRPGSKILAVSTDFPSLTRPWIAYSQSHDIDLRFVDEQPDQDLTQTLIQNIDEQTAVVAVSYVQFSTGTRTDIYRLREATQKVGARLVVDATQAAGAIPIDATGWQADVVVSSGYKWLGGHGGVALAVICPELLERTPPAPGWMGALDPFELQATQLSLANDARRYTQSTMSYISIEGLRVALGELLAMGVENIEAHSRSLATLLLGELEDSGWTPYRPLDDKAASAHLMTFSHPSADVESTVKCLRDANILCGSRNGRLRVSISHYNDEEDIRLCARTLR
ncbi:MAG: aminotransferase class V-fold PLP-dependent enzyme [Halieaceae bacterium]|jgi:cysteine desulfurase / selenocysteine lyase|nr:aminotransferase class V-fold PLP-dependent enzyme [Halieaceae bacterium]